MERGVTGHFEARRGRGGRYVLDEAAVISFPTRGNGGYYGKVIATLRRASSHCLKSTHIRA